MAALENTEAPLDARDAAESEHRVTPLELFFDLVFVFAITQVTGMLADDTTWGGVARALIVLAALWWAWAAYTWLTNEIDPDENAARLTIFGAMAAMLVAALAVPGAFGGDALAFAIAYTVVRALHILLYAQATDDVGVRAAILGLAPTSAVGCGLILAASAFDGAVQGALWLVALAFDYGGPLVRGMEGYRVQVAHFAERFGLIVIIALGESIVAVGVGANETELDTDVITAAVLATIVSAALWWAYFDVIAPLAEKRVTQTTGVRRAILARDAYAYLHLPMIAGIVLLALGIKKTLAHPDHHLDTVPAFCLLGGTALYLLAHVAFRYRIFRSVNRQRTIAALACAALIPLATNASALIALAALAVVLSALIAYEAIRFSDTRAQVRAHGH
jgi:low temperature requirement protein LtrA